MAHKDIKSRRARRAEFFTHVHNGKGKGSRNGGWYGGACGKLQYDTRRRARAAAKSLAHSGHDRNAAPGRVMNAYYCERCEAFHIGHKAASPSPGPRPGGPQ